MAVAVITGSSSGIGRATAVALAKAGYDVVLHARQNLQGLQETLQCIQASLPGSEALIVTGDISSAQVCRRLTDAAFAWKSHVDVWINNAGADILTEENRHADFDSKLRLLFETDVMGTIRLSRMVADRMLAKSDACEHTARECSAQPSRNRWLTPKQTPNESDSTERETKNPPTKPAIINLGWDQAEVGMEEDAGQLFCTTKSAVMSFTRALAMTYAPAIRVNCVCPGWIQTAWGASTHAYWDRRARSEALLNRWGTPGDVAQTIVWLASQGAEFVNGQCVPVNGGRRYYPHRFEG